MAGADVESLWKSTFGDAERPLLYSSKELNDDGFLPLNEPSTFLIKIPGMSREQLYVTSLNNQLAMKLAQDEYLDLERQISRIKGTAKHKNPQALPPLDVFEEQKEAVLYGYKYESNRPALLGAAAIGNRAADDVTDREKHDVRLNQEPFEQGGFVPTEKQKKEIEAKLKHNPNLDGWTPLKKNGKFFIPRQQVHHNEYNIKYVRSTADDNTNEALSKPGENINGAVTPQKVVDQRIVRITRFNGTKVPATRDVSEAPSVGSSKRGTDTPGADGAETPNSKRRRLNNDPDRPKHPNQYTKAREAREREARAAAAAAAAAAPRPKHPNQYTKAREAREAKEAKEAQEAAKAVKPKHPNQYTKAREAREREEREAAERKAIAAAALPVRQTPAPVPTGDLEWSQFSTEDLLNRKWTDAELVEAVKQHHSWLHPDPVKAADWKEKIITGINPVRSFSMFKKWAFWKNMDLDKRPRGKKDLVDGDHKAPRTPAKSRRATRPRGNAEPDSLRTTPSMTPAPDVQDNGRPSEVPHSNSLKNGVGGRTQMKIGMLIHHNDEDFEDDMHNGSYSPSTPVAEEGARLQGNTYGNDTTQPRPSLNREVSDSLIVVNGTPPLRRSMRSSRRSSG